MTTCKMTASSGFLFLSLVLLPHLLKAQAKGGNLEIEVCDFRVPQEIARANASFTAIYTLKVGENGRPIKVEKEKNDFLADEPFAKCIKNWVLPSSNERLVATFTWKHAEGWTEIAVSGVGVNYRIKLDQAR
ncbi:MAG: hypothetical protein ACJ71U_20320 [Terriglobales bacterium]